MTAEGQAQFERLKQTGREREKERGEKERMPQQQRLGANEGYVEEWQK